MTTCAAAPAPYSPSRVVTGKITSSGASSRTHTPPTVMRAGWGAIPRVTCTSSPAMDHG